MNPVLIAGMRRHSPLLVAGVLVVLLFAVHTLWFLPTAQRYQAVLKAAGGPTTLAQHVPEIPPRLFSLLTRNSLSPGEAVIRGNSGQLTVGLLDDLTSLASRTGLAVISTEPGPTTQMERAVQLRAHLRLRGSYSAASRFLDEMSGAGRLDTIQRFSLVRSGSALQFEVWVMRTVVKASGASK